MVDFNVINIPAVLKQEVYSLDEQGRRVKEEFGPWHQTALNAKLALAQFFIDKGLIRPGVEVNLGRELVLKFSELTEIGQQFWKSRAVDRWLDAMDRSKPASLTTAGLERRWKKFTAPKA